MKRILLNLRIGVRSLLSFKLRSILAILGVFLGTLSLVVVTSLSASLAVQTEQEIEKLGRNLLIISSGQVRKHARTVRYMSEATNLTVADAEAIAAGSTHVKMVSPSSGKLFPVRYGGKVLPAILVTGVMPNYSQIRSFYVQEGRFIHWEDHSNLAKVVVLGARVAENLFGSQNAIGQTVLVHRVPCRVIGVMEPKGSDISGADRDSQVFVPLNTYLRSLVNQTHVNTIFVQTYERESMAPAEAEITGLLRLRHRITSEKQDDFTVINMRDVTALQSQAMDTVSTLGAVSSAVSFVIGGMGILSIMILMVSERRMEIGIRRAMGSRKRDIVFQFLTESSFISLFGGFAGAVIGVLGASVIFGLWGLPYEVSYSGVLLALAASVAVGVLGGVYPSKKAISIQPVHILRGS